MKRLAALAAFQLSLFFKPRVSDDFFKTYSRLISPDVTEEEIASYPRQAEDLFFDRPETAARYQTLQILCDHDPIALTAIGLYLLALMEKRTLQLLQEGLGTGLTIEAAARITFPQEETVDLASRMRAAFDRVELLVQADPDQEWWQAPFHLDGRLAAWLSGDDTPDRTLAGSFTLTAPDTPLFPASFTNPLTAHTAAMLKSSPGFAVVAISGSSGSGRQHFARHTARLLGKELLTVPFHAVGEAVLLRPRPWRQVLRELLLTGRLLCLSNLECPPEQRPARLPALLRQLEQSLSPFGAPVFFTADASVKVIPFLTCPVFPVAIPHPTISQSAQLWRELSGAYLSGAAAFPADSLAAKMSLTPGQMERIIQLLRFQQPSGPWAERDLFKLCYQVLDDGRYENIRFVDTAYTWADLQLEPPLKAALQAICDQVAQQGLVLDEWGLRRRYPYGRCVSVLMSGPPGTGKTMTAQVLSAQLGLELYKVDLSQIVDKYIGETEKRLRQVFDQAEKSNMILFFDEADALLGKRSEVKDAKDKYANTEVAYLLQRMEEFQGIVLMATNQAGSIDAAFVRRFRYHLVYSLPNEELRRKIWADALSGIPSAGIQHTYLSRQFQLSGAQIKNIVLNGAYRAAAEGGLLRMEHLVRAIFQELQKEGKVLLSSDFGEYGGMLNEFLLETGPREA